MENQEQEDQERLEEFKKYNWGVFFPNNKKNKIYRNPNNILVKSVRNFANQFSPRQGFLGIKGGKKRTREDSIELIVKTGLVNNKKDAEEFIDKFKDKDVKLPPIEYFQLDEFKNFDQECFYRAKVGTYNIYP